MKATICTLCAGLALTFHFGRTIEQSANPSLPAWTGTDVAVKGLPEDRPLVEPHLAAHPRDANHLVAGAILSDAAAPFAASQTCASLVTFETGRTWATHVFDIQGCGDP